MPLARAAAFLWSQQAEDGGWHSHTYAVLRSGQAMTPMVLYALLQVPEHVYPRSADQVHRALSFLRSHTNRNGMLGLDDPEILEYPNYSTSLALRCLVLAGQQRDRETIAHMAGSLSAAQYAPNNGFGPDHLAHGGWGFAAPLEPGKPDHMDLAHTRCVLQALQAAEQSLASDRSAGKPTKLGARRPQQLIDSHKEAEAVFLSRAIRRRAEAFLGLLQRQPGDNRPHPLPIDWVAPIEAWHGGRSAPFDGGFYFSPIVLAANKGRHSVDPPGWRSYATATCDGLLALLVVCDSRQDPRITNAIDWIRRHADLDYPQGVPRDHPEPWGESLRFYHYAVRAEVYRVIDWPGQWRQRLCSHVAQRQRKDGSFVNRDSHLMKEDDPLLATALAVQALSNALNR